ncbi:MAG: MOSC domain-containing protein [Thermaerobacter sp.]|nr:MOSC domain-containing protein [Thermaerobacter sp.]
MWQVLSVQVGQVREMSGYAPKEQAQCSWRSATRKEPALGPVRLTRLGFVGDEQADTKNHGGEEKAVLFFPAAHYPRWREELPWIPFGPGGFGENLTVDCTEEDVAIGDVLAVGRAVVEISQPRVPCWKQAWRWGVEDLVERMQQTGRTGFYGRVLQAGEIQGGDTLTVLNRPHPEVTVARLSRARYEHAPAEERRCLAGCAALAEDWRRWLLRHAGA